MSQTEHSYLASGATRGRRSGKAIWLTQLFARLNRLHHRWNSKQLHARELRDLYDCSDRELRDLGLARADFPAIANGSFRRDAWYSPTARGTVLRRAPAAPSSA